MTQKVSYLTWLVFCYVYSLGFYRSWQPNWPRDIACGNFITSHPPFLLTFVYVFLCWYIMHLLPCDTGHYYCSQGSPSIFHTGNFVLSFPHAIQDVIHFFPLSSLLLVGVWLGWMTLRIIEMKRDFHSIFWLY